MHISGFEHYLIITQVTNVGQIGSRDFTFLLEFLKLEKQLKEQ